MNKSIEQCRKEINQIFGCCKGLHLGFLHSETDSSYTFGITCSIDSQEKLIVLAKHHGYILTYGNSNIWRITAPTKKRNHKESLYKRLKRFLYIMTH